MATIYKGTVSIVKNLKGEVTVKADPSGRFTQENVEELYTTALELAKKHKSPLRLYKPDANADTPMLFADRWGKPYLALLPARKAPSKATVVKLA